MRLHRGKQRTAFWRMGLLLPAAMATACNGQPNPGGNGKADIQEQVRESMTETRIIIKLPDTMITGSLNDSDAARAFAAMLPLNLNLEDYAATEKVADLPAKLPSQGSERGYTPKAGDVTYYAPWGNLAIFHKDFRHSPGLVPLGRLDSGGEVLARVGRVRVEIARETL